MPSAPQVFVRAVCAVALWGWGLTDAASADVFLMPPGQTSLEFVPVGDAGNPNDPSTGFGSVPYNYNIGKFEVTIGQYTQFLNAVAATDTYGLYSPFMTTNLNIAGIARSGSPGSYTYSPIDSLNRPIAYVSWGDAARFCNWLTNGQPTGPQGPTTTETGSYAINGANTNEALQAVTREPNAHYVIPTRNEWYKAARYDPTPGAGGDDNYWFYPFKTNDVSFDAPYSDEPPGTDAPNPALAGNFYRDDEMPNGYNDGYAVTGSDGRSDSQNYLTDVGAYTSALTYYGTFDQGGNLNEWIESIISSSFREIRGGSWDDNKAYLRPEVWGVDYPTEGKDIIGFRIAEVPEPATGLLLVALGWLPPRRKRTRRYPA